MNSKTIKEYGRSFVAVAVVAIAGLVLQLVAGYLDTEVFAAPVNLLSGGVLVLAIVAGAMFRESAFVRWLSGAPMAVALSGAILVMCLFMGLIPQGDAAEAASGDIYYMVGLRRVAVSWPFVLLYLFLLLSLGVVVAKRLCRFRAGDYAFYLNHLGLWLLLFAMGFGAADVKSYRVKVYEGNGESHGQDDRGRLRRLPFTISLTDFRMEEYAPRMALLDTKTWMLVPEGKPQYASLERVGDKAFLCGWELTVEEYIPRAARSGDGVYKAVGMPGAAEAVRVKAVNMVSGEERDGWVFRGNAAQAFEGLEIESGRMIVMDRPEPKGFASEVEVEGMGNVVKSGVVEVNKPMRIGAWQIYQYGYDTGAGKMSQYSIFNVVYDPWMWAVYVGAALLMAGSVCLLWTGRRRKEAGDGVE